jgi:DNA-binding transcriptional LysR family regulator
MRQLEYFMSLCEELHFTKTAEKLRIGQPTLSNQMKALEDELGVRLFDRLGKKIAITEAGVILLEQSKKVFANVKFATEQIEELQKVKRGKLVIGALSGDLSLIASKVLLEFHAEYPHVAGIVIQPIIESTDSKSILDLVEEGIGATIISSTLFSLENTGTLKAIKIKKQRS